MTLVPCVANDQHFPALQLVPPESDSGTLVPILVPPASQPEVYVPVVEIAAKVRAEPTTVRRWIWNGVVRARPRVNGRGYEVDVMTLPPKYRVVYVADEATSGPAEIAPRFKRVQQSAKERALDRLEAVLSFREARMLRAPGETLAVAEHRWLHNFRRSHPWMKVSIRSVKSWCVMFDDGGQTLDALVDGNDGMKQSGVRIPARAKRAFRDEFLQMHRPNLMLAYSNVVELAEAEGWGPLPSYHSFRRYARSIPKIVRALTRERADTPRSVQPYVVRDPSSVLAYHTVQSDHRQIDVPVRCDGGCEVCTGKKPRGHFPFWIAFIDVRSRRILATELVIDTPDSTRILAVFRRMAEEYGLPRRVNIDNGADYRRAFGKRLRKAGKTEWDGPSEPQLRARFAAIGLDVSYSLVNNPQGKAIVERMFRTFRHRFDEQFEAYRGTLGAKSEYARELYYRPSELPTVSELAYLLELEIERYNGTAHGGKAMNGRSPNEIFEEFRAPHRELDKGWAYLFYEPVNGGRFVGRNGVLVEGRTYRLESLRKHLEYFGEVVDVRINPDDPRVAAIFDLRTGIYICKATVQPEATYDTRDGVTRQIIASVFHDSRELRRMAKEHVEGAKERLAEYRRVRVRALVDRIQLMKSERQQQRPITGEVAAPAPLMLREATAAHEGEITDADVLALMEAESRGDAASSLCVVSPRRRRQAARPQHALSLDEIAKRLGKSRRSVQRYRDEALPWPEGMRERYEALLRLSAGLPLTDAERLMIEEPPLVEAKSALRRPRPEGKPSLDEVARELGMNRRQLFDCRSGKRPWPVGTKAKFLELWRTRERATE